MGKSVRYVGYISSRDSYQSPGQEVSSDEATKLSPLGTSLVSTVSKIINKPYSKYIILLILSLVSLL